MAADRTAPRLYRNRRVTVMGLGRFGGGVAVARFLVQAGARVTLTDAASIDTLTEPLAELEGLPFERLVFGRHDETDFTSADLVVVNPAVPPTHNCLVAAHQHGVPITTEIDLFLRHQNGHVVAVTGSNGKSTTTALIHSMLAQTGQRCWLGGNIGISLLPQLERIHDDDWVILELSSFQLHYLSAGSMRFRAGVVTGFSPNHLDWHQTLSHYERSKQRLLGELPVDAFGIVPGESSALINWPCSGHRCTFAAEPASPRDVHRPAVNQHGLIAAQVRLNATNQLSWETLDPDNLPGLMNHDFHLRIPDTRMPGLHNRMNIAAAATTALALGASPAMIQAGIDAFEPLPHRLELVAEFSGVRFYNDSLATTPESTAAAIHSFEAPISLIVGGYDKGVDLGIMLALAAARCRRIACIGQTGPECHRLITDSTRDPLRCRHFERLENAVQWLVDESTDGETILLSPGCASYGLFRNFRDRGEQFTRCVEQIVANARSGKLRIPAGE